MYSSIVLPHFHLINAEYLISSLFITSKSILTIPNNFICVHCLERILDKMLYVSKVIFLDNYCSVSSLLS
jgi:hypothetical protein